MAPRHLAWLFLCDPRHLKQQEQQTLSLIHKAKNVDRVYELVQQLVTMVKEHDATALDTWLWNCQMSGMSDLVTFAEAAGKGGFGSARGLNASLQQWAGGRENYEAEIYQALHVWTRRLSAPTPKGFKGGMKEHGKCGRVRMLCKGKVVKELL